MPPKSKRQRQSQNALAIGREKLARLMSGASEQNVSDQPDAVSESTTNSADVELGVSDLLSPTDAPDDDDETADPTFDLDASARSDTALQLESFCENWMLQLDRDDRLSLGIFLVYNLKVHMGKGETEAAELAGMMVGRSERTIHDWQSRFIANDFILPDSKQGQYQRSGVLWKDEELNRKASEYIRANTVVKGRPNLTIASFCQWINEELLPNATLAPGFPRRVSIETARCWLHELGFSVMRAQKGTFVDGHEREDVVEYRNKFIRRMVGLGFINGANAPTEEAKRALPVGIEPRQERIDKTVIFFHDESIYHVNEDQPSFWGDSNTHVLRPKSKGAGIMVSDFVEEREGYLALTFEQYDQAKLSDPHFPLQARQLLEYGDSKEGYWTSVRFMQQMERAVRIADFKYPKSDGWRCVWIFDHSSCHTCVPEDALDVNFMNVHSGGKQRVMCDGIWDGKVT